MTDEEVLRAYHDKYSHPDRMEDAKRRFNLLHNNLPQDQLGIQGIVAAKTNLLDDYIEKHKAKKHDNGKLRADLLPTDSIKEVVKVLQYGANKYGESNWKNGLEKKRIIAALLRHMFEIMDGNLNDKESSLMHAAHVACNALFLIHYQLKENAA